MAHKDKTLRDNNRRLLNLQRSEIENVLPEYFGEDYPKLLQLFDAYYDYMEEDDNPSRRIQDLYKSRDITQVEQQLLQYIEDELLLGQAYFGGFINKREAAKFSNVLYRSKGTLYSIQQFFRAFFQEDIDVIYTRNNVFKVGPVIDKTLAINNDSGGQVFEEGSIIGPESQKYLTNDKFYQTLAILIRSGIPLSKFLEVYKLFAHPAGMYIGAEVSIVAVNDNIIETRMPDNIEDPSIAVVIENVATATVQGFGDITNLVYDETLGYVIRQDVRYNLNTLSEYSIDSIDDRYSSLREFLTASSPTFDDSADSNGAYIRFDDTNFETLDLDVYDSANTIAPTWGYL